MASATRGGELVNLSRKQLHKLAETIHLQEVEKLYEIKFDSYGEQQQYLKSCKEARDKMDNLLNAVHTMKAKAEDEKDATKISIAHDIYEYSTKGISTSLQFIRSYSTRITFLDKLKDHSHDMIGLLHTIDFATQVEEAGRLARQASIYKDFMLDYARKSQHYIPNQFTRWLKETNVTFEDLVRKYMGKLGFQGSFQNLTDIQKLQVYEKIIEAAGRGKSVLTYTFKALGALGVALLIFSAAAMVWDISTAANKLEVAARNAVKLLTTVVGFGEITTVAIAVGLRAANIEVASAMITVMGTVVGIGVGVLIGVAAGALLDLIFMSGTTQVNTTDGLTMCRVAPMPNGLELARLVKHNHPNL